MESLCAKEGRGSGGTFAVKIADPSMATLTDRPALVGVQPLFWTVPAGDLGGAAAAGGVAVVNAVGALVAPNVKAWADASVGSSRAGLYALAPSTLVGAALLLGPYRTGQDAAEPLPSRSRAPRPPSPSPEDDPR